MLFELMLVGAGGFAVHKWLRSQEKAIAKNAEPYKKYNNIALTINLDIKSYEDYQGAIRQLKELKDYKKTTDDKTMPILLDAIEKLQTVISDHEKKHPGINQRAYMQDTNFKKAVSSFETSFSSGKLNKYYLQTYKDVYDQFSFKYDFRIKYIDSDSKSTQRDISVNNIEMYNGDGSIHAYCHLRKYQRTFKMDRVTECIDLGTGEFIDDIYKYLKDHYVVSPEKSLSDFMEKNSDILEVLFYLGKADTQLKKEERTIICEAVRIIAKDDRISDEMVNDIMNEMYPCSERTFKVKIGKMVEYPSDLKQDLFNTMLAIVNTQKTIHPAEQSALDYVTKKWDIPTNQK